MRKPITLDDYATGVLAGDRTLLARAITLIESSRGDHQEMAQALLNRILPATGKARRIGITGVPGVGKSTFIESFGCMLAEAGHKVAVLAVDPSSTLTGGSILGDKTRMERLTQVRSAFIRPSPSAGRLGGVHRMTRETLLLCEAAGFDIVIIETVGAGQNETVVADMVDFFLVLMLPGAGDELQGIKKGVLELADMVAVNKSDADEMKAKAALREYKSALHLITPPSALWQPPVLTCSGLTGAGLDKLWEKIELHAVMLKKAGGLVAKRRRQHVRWMWAQVEDRLLAALKGDEAVRAMMTGLEEKVAHGDLTATSAANDILRTFWSGDHEGS